MMPGMQPAAQPLVYNGLVIRERQEMLSLTDMWKAAGSPAGSRPADWKKDSAHRAFMEHVARVLNAPVGAVWKEKRGRNEATFAHWQIALAYAECLAPEFHMWCATVVRERMEGCPEAGSDLLARLLPEIRAIVRDVLAEVLRAHGIPPFPGSAAGAAISRLQPGPQALRARPARADTDGGALADFGRDALAVTRSSADQVAVSDLYGAFEIWCRSSGRTTLGKTIFSRRMPALADAMGFEKGKSSVSVYIGIRIRDRFQPSA